MASGESMTPPQTSKGHKADKKKKKPQRVKQGTMGHQHRRRLSDMKTKSQTSFRAGINFDWTTWKKRGRKTMANIKNHNNNNRKNVEGLDGKRLQLLLRPVRSINSRKWS